MLHACAEKFDMTENLEKFLVFGWTKQALTDLPHDRVSFSNLGNKTD
jgi:hypothetical protein